MGIFKKKPQKKRKPQVKKTITSTQKARPQQWTPPFPTAEKHQPMRPQEPKFIDAVPTYNFPQAKKDESPITLENHPSFQPERKEDDPREQTARKEFLRVFRSLTGRWRSWDIWTDFIIMAACAISNSVDKSHFDEREAVYLRIIKKYNKEEQNLFPELFAHLVIALEENPEQDFLGEVYTELGLNSKEHQQIFTPYHIARMMAEISIGDLEKQVAENGYVTIHDSCCGGGVTLIAAANVARSKLEKANLNFQNHILVTGQDIDHVVAMMCYIQLSLLGVAGYVKVGNALTEPMTESDSLDNYWFTPMYFFPVWNFRQVIREFDDVFQTENKTNNEIRSN